MKPCSQENEMRDVYEVLRGKEILIEQLRREIEALRLVAPLLNDDHDDRDRGSFADAPGSGTESGARNVPSIERLGGARLSNQSDPESTEVPDEETVGTAQRISGRLRRLARPVLDAVSSMAG
jgi:hypothetical protein